MTANLPTPAQMMANALAEFDKAYWALGNAADWLRSDWPAGAEMTAEQAERRTRMFRAIHDAKAAINVGRGAR